MISSKTVEGLGGKKVLAIFGQKMNFVKNTSNFAMQVCLRVLNFFFFISTSFCFVIVFYVLLPVSLRLECSARELPGMQQVT